MTTLAPLTLDVHAELHNGGEPLPRILQAAAQLQPDQPLRLLATFKPIPLYTVLGRKGFSHAASRHGNGDWELTPGPPTPNKQHKSPPRAASASTAAWPPPEDFLDNRGLLPPDDPELGFNIVDLGLVYQVAIDRRIVDVRMMTTPGCPVQDFIVNGVEQRLAREDGITGVFVEIVLDPPWSPRLMTPAARAHFYIYKGNGLRAEPWTCVLPAEWHRRIFETYERLAVGDKFVLVNACVTPVSLVRQPRDDA